MIMTRPVCISGSANDLREFCESSDRPRVCVTVYIKKESDPEPPDSYTPEQRLAYDSILKACTKPK